MSHTPRSFVLALLAASALLLGACSASGDDASGDATTTTAEGGSAPTAPEGSTTTEAEETTTTTEDEVPTPDDDGLVAEVADGLEGGLEIDDRDTALCVAAGWIDVVGEDRITDAGVDPAELGDGEYEAWASLDVSSSEASDLYAAIGACDHDVVEALAASLDEEEDLTEEQRSCIRDLLDAETVEEVLVATFQGEDGNDTALASGYEACYSGTGG